MLGGVNKICLARGPAAIRAEIANKVPFLIASGGCIPMVDHAVPPDISFEDFRAYRDMMRGIVESRL